MRQQVRVKALPLTNGPAHNPEPYLNQNSFIRLGMSGVGDFKRSAAARPEMLADQSPNAGAWRSQLLDRSLDEIARDSSRITAARCLVLVLVAALVGANLGVRIGATWFIVGAALESWCAVLKSRLSDSGTPRWRLNYLIMVACLSATWTTIPVLFWMSHERSLQLVAIAILASQLIHAQAFTCRSPAVLAFSAGFPAAAMLLLPAIFGGFVGLQFATVEAGLLLSLAYFAAAVRANLDNAASLAKAQHELERFAYFDALTSLANRRLFAENLRKLIAISKQRRSCFTLMLLDVDRFKQINDSLGHDAGDALLIEVGVRLCRAVREGDEVARLGGDEFGVLLPETGNPAEICRVSERITAGLAEGIELCGTSISPSASVGIAVYPDDGEGQESLFKAADRAMYEAKHNRRKSPDRRRAHTGSIAVRSLTSSNFQN